MSPLPARHAMARYRWLAALACSFYLSACGGPSDTKLGFRRVHMDDAPGLHGGVRICIDESGLMHTQVVRVPRQGESGMQETRWRGTLTTEHLLELSGILHETGFQSLTTSSATGIPGEGICRIHVVFDSGAHTDVRKFDRESNSSFQIVQQWLSKKAEDCARNGEKVYEGPDDRKWLPPGW